MLKAILLCLLEYFTFSSSFRFYTNGSSSQSSNWHRLIFMFWTDSWPFYWFKCNILNIWVKCNMYVQIQFVCILVYMNKTFISLAVAQVLLSLLWKAVPVDWLTYLSWLSTCIVKGFVIWYSSTAPPNSLLNWCNITYSAVLRYSCNTE